MKSTHNFKDVSAGATFMGIGLFFALYAYFRLNVGTAGSMGPGYFPLVLGLILIGLGLIIIAKAIGAEPSSWGSISVRGIVLITLSIAFFGFAVRTLGLGPAVAGSTVFAAFASTRTTVVSASVLTIAMTAFCLVLFVYVLGLPIPVIGPWLGGY